MLIHNDNPHLIRYVLFADLQILCLLSKKHSTSYREQRDLFVLLEAVFQGNEVKVAKLLAKKPELLMLRGTWTDSTDKTYEAISPLQYSIWGHDADMVRTMLECLAQSTLDLAEEIQLDLNVQIKFLRDGKLTYTKDNTGTQSTRTYDVSDDVNILVEVFRKFYAFAATAARNAGDSHPFLDKYFGEDILPALHASWIKLGRIFRESPVHVIQSYHIIQSYNYHNNVCGPGTQDFFERDSHHLFDDDNKLFSYLFKIRTRRSEPFFYNHRSDGNSQNLSWFSQKKQCGLGYDFGITAPFHVSPIYDDQALIYRSEVVVDAGPEKYDWLGITDMLHAVLGHALLLKLRAEEVNILLQSLAQPIQELQPFLNTLPERKDTSQFQYKLPRFFAGPSLWRKQTRTADTLHNKAQHAPNKKRRNDEAQNAPITRASSKRNRTMP